MHTPVWGSVGLRWRYFRYLLPTKNLGFKLLWARLVPYMVVYLVLSCCGLLSVVVSVFSVRGVTQVNLRLPCSFQGVGASAGLFFFFFWCGGSLDIGVTGLILSISGGCQCLNIGIVGAVCAYDYFGCGWVIIWGCIFSGPCMAWLLVCMWCVFPLSGLLVSVHSHNFILEGCSPMVQCVLVYACQQRLTGDPCLVWENSPLVVVRVQGAPPQALICVNKTAFKLRSGPQS
jgi:hypothetical protein